MGQQAFPARRDNAAKERRRLQRQKNSYLPGAFKGQDEVRNKDKKLPGTRELHKEALDLWLDFTSDPENGYEDYKTFEGCAPPSHEMVKGFIRWYIDSTVGRLDINKKPTVRTSKACAERFFGGFKDFTKTEVPEPDRKEIYGHSRHIWSGAVDDKLQWIKNTLTKDGKVVNKRKQKYNFRKEDFLKVVASMWKDDHKSFIPVLMKPQILFALQLYLFTGARVGSFMPSHRNKHERGLRYECQHIDLVLFPSPTAQWEIGWRVNQIWLKNNRDPEYTIFGIGIRDSKRAPFASGDLLLGLALGHGALFAIESRSDLANFDLSNGEIPLRWKESYLKKPIFRNVTARGPQDTPLTNKDFYSYLHMFFDTAGYSEHPTIHCIRRDLAQEVEKRYGSAPVSQILAQRDPKTFPEHYQAHCSSVDTVSAVLDEKKVTKHIEFFQGYGQFCQAGLPLELPAHIKESVLMLPEMVEMSRNIEVAKTCNAQEAVRVTKQKYKAALARQHRAKLKEYQASWVQTKRDEKILNRGKGEPAQEMKNTCTRAQYLIMPELARIAASMSCTDELTFEKKLSFVEDLRILCSRKEDVIYLPNEEPIEGLCPAKDCQIEIQNLAKGKRSAHIHDCVRRETGLLHQVPESSLRYCYECMKWFLLQDWQVHCTTHLQSWEDQHCEVVKYRHTVIRPAYCPFCLGNCQKPAEERLQYWTRSGNLREHIESQHMQEISWPPKASICGCSQTFENQRELRHHLHDVHGLNKTIWRNPKPPRKRKATDGNFAVKPGEKGAKKLRFYHCPPQCQGDESLISNKIFVPIPAATCFIIESPQETYCSSSSESYSSGARCNSVETHLSTENSQSSSLPTTPGFDVIDPRILEPLNIDKDIEHQGGDETVKLDSLTGCLDEFDRTKPSFNYITKSVLPAPTTEQAAIGIGHEMDGDINAVGEKCTEFMSFTHYPARVEDYGRNDVFTEAEKDSENEMDVKTTPARIKSTSPTYGRDGKYLKKDEYSKHEQKLLPSAARPNLNDLRQKLNARDRRKLLALKSEKKTLRQIAPQFPHLDTGFLRQAWGELKPFERCTRSRVSRNR
ncbi:hypothetical protein N7509_000111 [Penicillium cosmopolitanum]|uniref:Uncharacterized protein n=1 Tax=Penicillium cosmopolitanum TaxID=1131564 RepID=A0A9W9WCU4_9EURO|nr:uncharacterized protein N7509_000111 [Penicillium cosmopolitanum]KAJ5415013.1 hypothetical protein N7509_000111 [Penicillium cosmopolitanum]